MGGRNSLLPFVAVAGAGVFGAWLLGMFETGETTAATEVSGVDMLLAFAGFLLLLGGLVGLLFLLRRALPPIGRAEVNAWVSVREQGKARFVRRSVRAGLLYGLFVFGGLFVYHSLRGDRFDGDVTVYAALLLIFVIGAWYHAVRTWAINEEAYKQVSGEAQRADGSADAT
jgi:hypothetical protein